LQNRSEIVEFDFRFVNTLCASDAKFFACSFFEAARVPLDDA